MICLKSLCLVCLLPTAQPVSVVSPIPAVVDSHIQNRLDAEQVQPAPMLSDAMWLRRVTLDLAGRIPTPHEVTQFVENTADDKRAVAVDRLMNSADYAYHERNVLDDMLQAEHGEDREWRAWLLRSIREGRAWHEIFRTIMIGREDNPEERPALAFLRKRAGDIDVLTNDASRLFFGVSVNCAQCHDHPLVADWQQDHYFGFKSFFARTYVTRKQLLAEKPPQILKFKTTEGEEKVARLMFLTGAVAKEPEDKRSDEQKKKDDEAVRIQLKDDNAPPPKQPKFSPRRKLVDLALAGENNRFFARAMVNRTWARFFARGLVDPLDQLHSENPASHPELLDWLTREFIGHNYNLRWLERGLVLSDAYARSSAWESETEIPAPDLFAVATARPLAPRQYTLSLVIASISPAESQKWQAADTWPAKRRQLEDRTSHYLREFERPGENFSVAVDEALLFANSDRIRNDFIRDGNDRLFGDLKKQTDHSEMIRMACLSILSREPEPTEIAAISEFLAARTDRRDAGIRDMLWALMTSPELRFNH